MPQQTAVEWLIEKLMKGELMNSPEELIIQAKQMEKEQIIDAYISGDSGYIPDDGTIERMAEEHYKKVYGK